MESDQKEYVEACRRVLKFQDDFSIPWDRFGWLKEMGLPGLNRKRWAPSVKSASAFQDRSRKPTMKLAEKIEKNEQVLLEGMGLGKRWLERKPKALSPEISSEDIFSKLGTSAEANVKGGFILAGRGHGRAAFDILIDGFVRCEQVDEPSTIQLAAAVYISYRYLDPSVWRIRFPAVIKKVKEHERPIPEEARALCLSQIATALCEGHDRGRAGELFALPGVRDLKDKCKVDLWNPAHVMRKFADFYLLDSQTTKAMGLIRDAERLDPSPTGNRAAAMFRWFAGVSRAPERNSFSSAWESIRGEYDKFRLQFVAAAMNDNKTISDALHLFAVIQKGAVSRYMADEKYPKSELAEDCHAMNSCLRRFGPVRIVTPSMRHWFPKLPGELAAISEKCLYSPLDERSKDSLWDLAKSFI
jgi:hypothetical protein